MRKEGLSLSLSPNETSRHVLAIGADGLQEPTSKPSEKFRSVGQADCLSSASGAWPPLTWIMELSGCKKREIG